MIGFLKPKTLDGAQVFFEKMAVLPQNDFISAFDNTGDSDYWPRNLQSLTFSNSASMCSPINQMLGYVNHLLSVMCTQDYFHNSVEPYEQIDSEEFIESGQFSLFCKNGRYIRKKCIQWQEEIEKCEVLRRDELKEELERDTPNLYALLVDLDHIINGKYANVSLEAIREIAHALLNCACSALYQLQGIDVMRIIQYHAISNCC